MASEIVTAINELIKSGNLDATPVFVIPNFDTQDIYPTVKHLFNANAVKTLDNKIGNLLHQYNEYVGPKGFDKWYAVEDLLRTLKVIKSDAPFMKVGYVRKVDMTYFFGSTCEIVDLGKAVEKIIVAINTVADMGFTKASLMPLSVIKLQMNPIDRKYKLVVLSYVTLTDVGHKWVQANMPKMLTVEGGIPSNVEDQ